jgi:hypothetical protein
MLLDVCLSESDGRSWNFLIVIIFKEDVFIYLISKNHPAKYGM